MADFQLLACHIALAGDPRSVVPRGKDAPVTYPELAVLQSIHGQDAVTDVYEIGTVERSPREERERLNLRYTKAAVEGVFPGSMTSLPARGDFPTEADVLAVRKVADEAMAKRRAKAKAAPAGPPVAATIAPLEDVPMDVA
jgi:hypothetical protein